MHIMMKCQVNSFFSQLIHHLLTNRFAEAMGAVVDYEEASEQTNHLHKIDIHQTPAIKWGFETNGSVRPTLY